jgi:RNase P subunit RPR2
MKGYGKTWKQKYHKMWSMDFWKEGRILLEEYFKLENGKTICKKCGRPLVKFRVLHHDMYNTLNYFTPLYCEIVCGSCHYKEHKKK